MVSTNTSKMPNTPCFTGFFVSAQACAIEPVPRPASLEKMPRETPRCMLMNRLPMAPPVKAFGLNAPTTIDASTSGRRVMFRTTTPSPKSTYKSAINGTSFSLTLPMRLMPPSSTMATSIAHKMPMTRFTVGMWSAPITLYCVSAVSIAVTMVFTCVALPVPNTVSAPNSEYSTAKNCQCLPRPFLM